MMTAIKNTVSLNVDLSGNGQSVLLLHGFPDSNKLWQPITPFFEQNNYQVIAPDMRGYGESPMPKGKRNYKTDLIVADLVALLKDKNIPTPIHVIGHDWGAVIAWCFALAHPSLVKKVVAVSVGHPKAYAYAGWEQKKKGLYVLKFQLTSITEYLFSKNNYAGLRRWAKSHRDIDRVVHEMSRPGRLTAGFNYYRANLLEAFTRSWPNCKVPVLGIWSTKDDFLSEDQMTNSEKYMDAEWQYTRMEDVGHWIPLDQPKRLFEIAHEWLQK